MRAVDRTLVEWLGEEGLAGALKSSLDKNSLVRLANARRVTVPGMRNQSVPAERLARLLAEKFVRDETARRPLLSALDTANRKLLEEWRQLPDEEARARVADEKITGASAGRLLYVLARERRDAAGIEQARSLAARCRPPKREEPASDSEPAPAPGAVETLRQEREDLTSRLREAEESLEKSRRREKQALQELAQRKFDLNNLKLQLAHGKQAQERLEKELRALQQKVEETTARRRGGLSEELSNRMNQILDGHRKLAASVERLVTRLPKEDKKPDATASTKVLETLRADLKAGVEELRGAAGRTADAAGTLSHEVGTLRELAAALKAPPARRSARSRAERPQGGAQRVGLFVDVQNVFYGARQQNARLDFEALFQTVSAGRKIIRATAYVVETREIDQSAFISLLQQKGYEVRRKPLKVRADGSFKGDWDMEMALDVLDIAEALDVLVLVTGDGDFTSLVARVKALGVEVEVYSFPRNTAKELREGATRFVPIDRRLLIKQPKEAPAPEPLEGSGS